MLINYLKYLMFCSCLYSYGGISYAEDQLIKPLDIKRLNSAQSVKIIISGFTFRPADVPSDDLLKRESCSINTDTPTLINKFAQILANSVVMSNNPQLMAEPHLALYYQYPNGEHDKFLFQDWFNQDETKLWYFKNDSEDSISLIVPKRIIMNNFKSLFDFCYKQNLQ